MPDVKKILVFPAGTEIAFEIYHALRFNKAIELYGGTSVPCHAEFVFRNCVDGIPYVDAPGFIESLNQVIDRLGIEYIYPAHDSVCLTLTREQPRLHARVISSPLETVELCRSKNATYRFLEGADYIPRFFSNAAEPDSYPVFIKPSVGQGAVGARLVKSREELDAALASGAEYAICEYLPGRELTVDCFTDRHGLLRYVGPRSRDRIKTGIAVRSHFISEDPRIKEIAEDINSRLSFNGAWFFQIKEDSRGQYKLMEIAPRIAGTMGLSRNEGINLPLLTLYNSWGYDVDILNNRSRLILDRAFISRFSSELSYERVYIDYDDTLTLRGGVNPTTMAFLYQARNQGKEIFLLSRHEGDLEEDMERLCIPRALFSGVIHLSREGSKAEHISGPAIFIDDSFAERRQVQQSCGIPVFDVDAIESLIDWRA